MTFGKGCGEPFNALHEDLSPVFVLFLSGRSCLNASIDGKYKYISPETRNIAARRICT